MKIGRNDPCYCGSGIKYKNCCLNKDDCKLDIARGLMGLHSYVLNGKVHIKKYRKLRKVEGTILDAMLEEIENERFLFEITKDMIKSASSLAGYNIDFDKLKKVMYDGYPWYYGLYMFGENSLANLYLDSRKYSSAFENKILNGMVNAYTGLFEIVDTDMSSGIVVLRDVINGLAFNVVDEAMSFNPVSLQNLYIYSRIVTVDDVSFNNCSLAINKDNSSIKKYIDNRCNGEYSDLVCSLALFYIMNRRDNKVSMSLI